MKIYQTVFLYTTYTIFILTVLAILGVSTIAPLYLKYVKSFMQIFIGSILVYFYNPLTYNKEKKFTEFDRQLVFSSGTFLLLSSALISIIENYIGVTNMIPFGENIRNILQI